MSLQLRSPTRGSPQLHLGSPQSGTAPAYWPAPLERRSSTTQAPQSSDLVIQVEECRIKLWRSALVGNDLDAEIAVIIHVKVVSRMGTGYRDAFPQNCVAYDLRASTVKPLRSPVGDCECYTSIWDRYSGVQF